MSNISFSYGDRKSLLRNINYFFEVGKCYAIVGPSGVGKSTLADIILGLSMPDSGELVVNEGSLSFYMARKKILLVEQQPKIFSASLRDNILLGIKVNDDVLLDALDVVSLMELVEDIDSGLDTELYYLGENFSGGQRQRIGIARALVNNPDVLILDEATSALDSLTRSKVVSKLRVKMRNGIIIFITHDLEIAELADEILELSIPEMG